MGFNINKLFIKSGLYYFYYISAVTLIIQKVLSQFTNNTLNTLKTHYELKNIQLHNTKNTNFSNLFSLSQNNDSIVKKSTFSSIPILSKKLNLVTKNISLETYYNINKNLNNSSKINS